MRKPTEEELKEEIKDLKKIYSNVTFVIITTVIIPIALAFSWLFGMSILLDNWFPEPAWNRSRIVPWKFAIVLVPSLFMLFVLPFLILKKMWGVRILRKR
jgi:hypothetical protein